MTLEGVGNCNISCYMNKSNSMRLYTDIIEKECKDAVGACVEWLCR